MLISVDYKFSLARQMPKPVEVTDYLSGHVQIPSGRFLVFSGPLQGNSVWAEDRTCSVSE